MKKIQIVSKNILNIGDILDVNDKDSLNSPAWGVGYIESIKFDETENEYKYYTFFPSLNKKYWLYQSKIDYYVSRNEIFLSKNEQRI